MASNVKLTKAHGCDYSGYEFGAGYLDSACIDGYLCSRNLEAPMSDINEPTMPAIPEAAIEAAAIALWNREGGGPDPVPGYIRHDAYATLAAALPHLSIPSAPAPIQGDVTEEEVHDPVAYRYRWGGDEAWTLSHDCPRFASETLEVQPLFARRAHPSVEPTRVELEREAAQWQAAAGQSLVRAEALEDRLETVERERDEAREYGKQARLRENAAEDARIHEHDLRVAAEAEVSRAVTDEMVQKFHDAARRWWSAQPDDTEVTGKRTLQAVRAGLEAALSNQAGGEKSRKEQVKCQ